MKNRIQIIIMLCLLSGFMTACGLNRNRPPQPTVSIAITIQASDPQLSPVNLDIYAFKVIDRLEDFNVVDLDLTEDADTAAVNLTIDIDRYTAFPPETRISRRVFRRNIQAGTDASGRPIYRTITATADIVQSRIRTSALFNTNLIIKGTPGKTFKRSFSNNLNIDNVYVTNIQGDPRALDPSVHAATFPPMEPLTDDILLALSNQEMLDRLSREIRLYYSK
jgi:hypothetical protein